MGQVGVDPDAALWMTPREMSAAVRGWGRAERTRFVTVAQAFGADIDERKARQIIEGEMNGRAPSHEEQQRRLEALAEKHDWDL